MSVAPQPSGRPPLLAVRPEGIPGHLTRDARWVCWVLEPKRDKPGEWTKEPYRADRPTAHASSTNPKTWATFDAAFMAYQTSQVLDGVGYNLEGSGVVGLDLDDAIDEDGRIKPWAREIVDAFPGYWERSPLGRGLRGLALGTLPPGRRKIKYHGCTVEMYAAGRYLTITGQVLRAVDELPNLQDTIEAIHARIFGGTNLADAGVVTTMTGAAETVPAEYMPVLEAVLGGKYAERMARVWVGNYDDFDGDESNGEWALAREITYHAMQAGFEGDELALVAEALMRAGPYRDKWEQPRTFKRDDEDVQTTWLGRTIGRAIESRKRKDPVLALDFDDDHDVPAPDAPVDETPAQMIAHLERKLAKERAIVAAQQTIIRSLRAELERERELRARDRRLALAEQRIRRCSTLSATQRDVLVTSGRVAPALANTHDTDAPIVTREMIAPGGNLKTAGEALKVLDLPGMPIRREAVRLGPARTVTAFKLETRDAAELLERIADVVETLDARPRPARKPTPLRCALHPDAEPVAAILCGHPGCARRLDGPEIDRSQGDEPQGGEKRPLADSDPRRGCTGTYEGEKRPLGVADSDELAEWRARQAVGIPTRAPDKWKQPAPPEPEPVSLGRVAMTRARPCPECETREPHYSITGGETRCPDCGHVSRDDAEVAG